MARAPYLYTYTFPRAIRRRVREREPLRCVRERRRSRPRLSVFLSLRRTFCGTTLPLACPVAAWMPSVCRRRVRDGRALGGAEPPKAAGPGQGGRDTQVVKALRSAPRGPLDALRLPAHNSLAARVGAARGGHAARDGSADSSIGRPLTRAQTTPPDAGRNTRNGFFAVLGGWMKTWRPLACFGVPIWNSRKQERTARTPHASSRFPEFPMVLCLGSVAESSRAETPRCGDGKTEDRGRRSEVRSQKPEFSRRDAEMQRPET
jgi:hypothetical protein